ncbi:MAG TPA: NAD(P)/FAD-dependent oxidoreductase [Candidatus Binatia bacterium]|jgi:protoporphyrinogen oxidase|nr:NAD(P)/FAD-dependent oxidoreductase [Candidatus Binatia bacterium]
METSITENSVVVIGAGPAGLTAAYELTKHKVCPMVIEKRDIVGGLARTETYKGFHFDMGGHRFFTKAPEVKKMWQEILGADFLHRPRLSRIYYKKKFFYYPLKPLNALAGLGFLESFLIVVSYLWCQIFPYRREDTFEQWVTNRFGKRLFQTFFKAYTEKVWGIPCSELKAEWAAQRIKDLSLKTALLNMFLKPKKTIKTLIEEFEYPRLGPGMMWNRVKEQIETRGALVRMQTDVAAIMREGNRIESITVAQNGHRETIQGREFISSMPVTEFIKKLDPSPPPAVLDAAEKIHYRDFLTVCLVVNKPELFPDNWIYVHDPEVKVGRIQNFKNWSPEMVPNQAKSSLGLEYFCTEGDELWSMPDAELIELGKREVDRIGLASYADIEDGCVCRVPKAYPVYDSDYREYLVTVREFVDGLENFHTIGRNGLHRYNNQDHAMLTGMLAVRNIVLGERNDLWSVNSEQEYLEEMPVEAEIGTPKIAEVLQGVLSQAFPKLDRLSFGLSLGMASGVILSLITLILVLKGGETVGPNLQLLSQYFPGYSVTLLGSVLGLAYGFGTGFVGGWGFAFLRNTAVFFYMAMVHRRAERQLLREILKYF